MDTVTVDLTKEELLDFMEVLKREAGKVRIETDCGIKVSSRTNVTRIVAEEEIDSLGHAISQAQRPETCQALINAGSHAEPHEKPTSALETLGHIALAAWVLVALYWLIRVLGA